MVYFIKSGKLKVVKEIKTYKSVGRNRLLGSPTSHYQKSKDSGATLPNINTGKNRTIFDE